MHFKLKSSLQQTLLLTGALLTVANLASGQAKPRRRNVGLAQAQELFKPGEIILICKPGTAQADVTRLAALVNATQIIPLLQDDGYHLVLDANHLDNASTMAAIAQLNLDPTVSTATPNRIYRFHATTTATPNDPRYKTGEQYGLALINMPQAWVLQKGDVKTTVAVMDSGFDPQHEDSPFFSPGSYNAVDGTANIQFTPPANGENDHGVGTSGVIGAHTNNGIGIAGVLWNRVPILGIKIQDSTGALNSSAILNGYAFVLKNQAKYNITALNLSYGADYGPGAPIDPTDPEYIALQQLANAGVNIAVSAGNNANGDTIIPAWFPFVVSVSAVGRDPSKLSSYSSFGKVEIAAPGGDQNGTGINSDGILLLSGTGGYNFEDGTSFAAPHVAGVFGLLRSVPGVTATRAQDALLSQANHIITGQASVPDPNKKFGYGLLDAYAALSKVSNVISILEPEGIDPTTGQTTSATQQAPAPVQTLRPRVHLHMTNVAVVNNVPKFTLTLNSGTTSTNLIVDGAINTAAADANGPRVTDLFINNQSIGNFAQYDVSFLYRAADLPISQQQQLVAISTPSDPSLPTVSSSLNFDVTPHSFPSGISMVAFPIAELPGDSPIPAKPVREVRDILGFTDPAQACILYRWVNATAIDATGKPNVQGQYAINGSGSTDSNAPLATLHPTDVATVPVPGLDPLANPNNLNNFVTNATPVGLGYFLNITSGAAVRTFGRQFSQQTIRVPLHEGWNMIGNPYTFPIAFSNLAVETSNGTRYNAPDAVTNKLILPFIYRFVGGQYSYETLPNGTLQPWEGNWIYVIPANPNVVNSNSSLYTLVVAPTQAGNVINRGVKGLYASLAAKPTRAVGTLSSKPEVHGAGSWALRLMARSNNTQDENNFIGMSSDSSPTNIRMRAPKPPMFGSHVSLGIQGAGTNAMYAQDLRPLGGTQTWDVAVAGAQPNTDVTVTWPEVHTMPRNYQMILTDKETGRTLDMRSQTTYHFNSGPNAQGRALTVTAAPANTVNHVSFNSVVVTPRGGKATGTASIYQIDYNLSGAAQVDVSILGTGGRVLATVDQGRAVTVGDNHVVWNGRDGQNRTMAAGSYIVRLRAVSADGKVNQYHHPLTITR